MILDPGLERQILAEWPTVLLWAHRTTLPASIDSLRVVGWCEAVLLAEFLETPALSWSDLNFLNVSPRNNISLSAETHGTVEYFSDRS